MKKNNILFILILFLVYGNTSFAQKNLKAYLDSKTYYSPVDKGYFEIDLSIDGSSIEYKDLGKNISKGAIEITMIFSQNDSIFAFKKYNIDTPEYSASDTVFYNLLSQERFSLPAGKYDFTLVLKDLNSKNLAAMGTEKFEMPDYSEFSISDILLAKSYDVAKENSKTSKSNLEFFPHYESFYPQNEDKIIYYFEIYNSNKVLSDTGQLLVVSGIYDYNTNVILPSFSQTKRMKAKDVIPFISQFDIKNLPTGNYFVGTEIRDRYNNSLINKKIFVQRFNEKATYDELSLASVIIDNNEFSKINNKDSLLFIVKSLSPIASPQEKIFINNNLKDRDVVSMQRFLTHFWSQRDINQPYNAWKQYNMVVRAVQEEFGTKTILGFDTDRGRIYLQYGAPDQRVKMTDNPVSMPYEIWQYYKYRNQSNVKFVFISRSQAHDYMLEHSTAEGEVKNVDWQNYLMRSQQSSRSDDPNRLRRADDSQNFGERSGEIFNLEY